jgi:hypothetical protein
MKYIAFLGIKLSHHAHEIIVPNKQKKTNKQTVALNLQSIYTDCATAAVRRILVPKFADKGVSCGQSGGSLRRLFSVF